MRGFLAALIFFLTPLSAVYADSPTSRSAVAQEIMVETKSAEKLKSLLPLVFTKLRELFLVLHPQLQKEFDAVAPKVLAKAQNRIGELQLRIAAIYASRFSEPELKEILAFLKQPAESRDVAAFKKAPTGMKYLNLRNEIQAESRRTGEEWGSKIGAEADEEIKRELKKSGAPI
jgi:uncharacterized protein